VDEAEVAAGVQTQTTGGASRAKRKIPKTRATSSQTFGRQYPKFHATMATIRRPLRFVGLRNAGCSMRFTRRRDPIIGSRALRAYVTPSLYITPYLRAEVFADYSFSSVKKAPASAINERCVPLTKSQCRSLGGAARVSTGVA